MITTMMFDPADRRRSLELVADIAAQARADGTPGSTAKGAESAGAAAPEETPPGLVGGRGRRN
jgi:hypothetical protein